MTDGTQAQHALFLVESKDGRHHYAALGSTAKIRAGRLLGSLERQKPKRQHPQLSPPDFTFSHRLRLLDMGKYAVESSYGNKPLSVCVQTSVSATEDVTVQWANPKFSHLPHRC